MSSHSSREDFEHRLPIELADVVHQNVEAAEALDDFFDHRAHLRLIGRVGFHGEAFGFGFLQMLQRGLRGDLLLR